MLLTGGTFASEGTDTTYKLVTDRPLQQQQTVFAQLIGKLKGIEVVLKAPPYFIDSSSLQPMHILENIRQNAVPACTDPLDVHQVFMVGTDTAPLAALAAKLAGIPGVFAGAMKPANSAHADGPLNARNAVLVAGSSHPWLRGQTLLVMNNEIFDPLTVRKAHTTAIDAFQPRNGERIGTIVNGRIKLERRPMQVPRLDLSTVDRLPSFVVHTCDTNTFSRQRADIERKLQLDTASEHEDAQRSGPYQKILVVAARGNGKVPDELEGDLRTIAWEQDTFVFRTTEVDQGVVEDQPGDEANRFINCGALRADKVALFAQMFLADARARNRKVDFAMMREAVNALQPVR